MILFFLVSFATVKIMRRLQHLRLTRIIFRFKLIHNSYSLNIRWQVTLCSRYRFQSNCSERANRSRVHVQRVRRSTRDICSKKKPRKSCNKSIFWNFRNVIWDMLHQTVIRHFKNHFASLECHKINVGK